MKQDEKIFDLFRDNQHKLDEMPSPRAWNRLEERLETRKVRKQGYVLKRFAIAAAVFIACSMVALWSYVNPLNDMQNNRQAALFSERTLPSELVASDASEPATPILMSHREKAQYLTESVRVKRADEPSLAKKSAKPTRQRADRTNVNPQIAQLETIEESIAEEQVQHTITKDVEETNELIALNDVNKSVEKEKMIETPAVAAKPTATMPAATTTSTADVSIEDLVEDEEIASAKDKAYKVKELKKEDLPETTVYQPTESDWNDGVVVTDSYDPIRNKAEEARRSEMLAQEERTAKKSKSSAQKRKTSNAPAIASGAARDTKEQVGYAVEEMQMVEEEASDDAQIADINQFSWLIGRWMDNSGQSYDQWQRVNDHTITGEGYFTVNNEVVFSEKMKLIQEDEHIYLVWPIDNQTEARFQLVNHDGGQAVFQNNTIAFPTQITLQQNATNRLTIRQSSTSNIPTDQQDYLQNRNDLESKQAVRQLTKGN